MNRIAECFDTASSRGSRPAALSVETLEKFVRDYYGEFELLIMKQENGTYVYADMGETTTFYSANILIKRSQFSRTHPALRRLGSVNL